jgi:hypothetical protein
MVMKHFCDQCGSGLVGPASKLIKCQVLPGSMDDKTKFVVMSDSVPAPVMADVTVAGEYCDACKRNLVANLRLAVDLGPQAKRLGA